MKHKLFQRSTRLAALGLALVLVLPAGTFPSLRDPDTKSRRIFAFHTPDTLLNWASDEDSLRKRLQQLPPLITAGLRDCQTEAIQNLERSFSASRPRALIQMATGSGKTFMAVSAVYRLIKFPNARRVLFLVDRNTLGRQTHTEFQQYVTPDDGRKFTDLYNVQHLTSNVLDPVCRVTISTIQRLYSMLSGQDYDPEVDEHSTFDDVVADDTPKEISFNPRFPIETFDFIITDECHRSHLRYVQELNDAFNHFFFHYSATPLLVVETSKLAASWSDPTLDEITKQLQTLAGGTRYYVPRAE